MITNVDDITATPADISVVIPAYNAQSHLGSAVQSVLDQQLSPSEVIIVNDGSEDNTSAIAHSFDHPAVRVIDQSNAGPGAARNAGMLSSTARWIAFLDADDQWQPDFLSHAISSLQAYPDIPVFICKSHRSADPLTPKPALQTAEPKLTVFPINKEATVKQIRRKSAAQMATVLAERELVKSMGGFYEKNHCTYGEDGILGFLLCWNYPVLHSDRKCLVYHILDTGLTSARQDNPQIIPFIDDPEHVLERIPDQDWPIVRRYLRYVASKEIKRLAKQGRSELSKTLFIKHQVWRSLHRPGIFWRCLCVVRYAMEHAVKSRLSRQ